MDTSYVIQRLGVFTLISKDKRSRRRRQQCRFDVLHRHRVQSINCKLRYGHHSQIAPSDFSALSCFTTQDSTLSPANSKPQHPTSTPHLTTPSTRTISHSPSFSPPPSPTQRDQSTYKIEAIGLQDPDTSTIVLILRTNPLTLIRASVVTIQRFKSHTPRSTGSPAKEPSRLASPLNVL